MEIQGVRLVGQQMAESRLDGNYVYTVHASFVTFDLVDGQVTDIDGLPLALLRAEGWQPEARIDLTYPATAAGGSPSLAEIATDLTAWLAAELTARVQAWVGRSVVAFVTDKESNS